MALYYPESQAATAVAEGDGEAALLTADSGCPGRACSPLPFPTKAFPLSVLWYLQNSWIFLVHSWKWSGKGSSTRILIQDGCSHGKITEVMGFFSKAQ